MCDTSLKAYFQDKLNGTISVKISVLGVEKLRFEVFKIGDCHTIQMLLYISNIQVYVIAVMHICWDSV